MKCKDLKVLFEVKLENKRKTFDYIMGCVCSADPNETDKDMNPNTFGQNKVRVRGGHSGMIHMAKFIKFRSSGLQRPETRPNRSCSFICKLIVLSAHIAICTLELPSW